VPASDGNHATVFLRPIGAPLTLAMAGLTIASLVTAGLALEWIDKSQAVDVGIILVSVPFILQLVASVLTYLARDGAAGAAVGVLAATWLAFGLVQLTGHGSRSGALGLLLLSSGGVLCASAASISLDKPLVGLVVLLAGARFALDGIYQLGAGSGWQHAAGAVGLAVAATAGYCVLAFELEDARGRPLLPTVRRARGKRAIADGFDAQIDGVANEAGVRHTS
jgi:hypothetical protein